MDRKSFRKYLLESMDDILKKELTFKSKRGLYYYFINNDFYVTIGLGTTSYFEINPSIGIGCVQVENIFGEIYGEAYRKNNPLHCTIGQHLGYVTDYNRWRPLDFLNFFNEHASDDELKTLCNMEFNRFRQEYAVYVTKFIEDNNSIEKIRKNLEEGKFSGHHSLPIIYFLLGMNDKAIEFINNQIKERATDRPYLEYAAKLIAYINNAPVKEIKAESNGAKEQDMMFGTSKEAILKALTHYGETEIFNKLLDMTKEQHEKIEELTPKYLFQVSPIPKAVVMACVELIEGKPREVSIPRKKRTPNS